LLKVFRIALNAGTRVGGQQQTINRQAAGAYGRSVKPPIRNYQASKTRHAAHYTPRIHVCTPFNGAKIQVDRFGAYCRTVPQSNFSRRKITLRYAAGSILLDHSAPPPTKRYLSS
jgi:hypothetical protein